MGDFLRISPGWMHRTFPQHNPGFGQSEIVRADIRRSTYCGWPTDNVLMSRFAQALRTPCITGHPGWISTMSLRWHVGWNHTPSGI